ncbi:hypothetical protein SAMN04487944_101501 [Gracilibacillus ureilyticus]|uniref:DUF4190 domain-containing protein n=1 Tax=Gracilibacillus ureilyticus TaxID=531814 RepID=A0A1H9M0U8_9BACI|nr:hypothetical protein [Gracilibacillus ureilyticus]SER17300.1 hypothetical protein SAMN04487944_101501 [Gracilibacillus ureilyticus]
MSNEHEQNRVEDAPKINNNDQNMNQIAPTDELYAVDEAYKREAEASQELTANEFNRPVTNEEQGTQMQTNVNSVFGWIGLIMALASFFVWPLLMAAGGLIFGFVSKKQGADTLGNSAIVISVISLIVSIILLPLF